MVKPLPDGSAKRAGNSDHAGRWYPKPEFQVPGSFQVRSPSARWPYSYLKHFYSRKYAQLLIQHDPMLYLETARIDPDSAEATDILKDIVLINMTGKVHTR